MTDEDVVRKLAALIPAGNVLKAGRRTKSQPLIDLMIVLRPLMGKRRRERFDSLLAHS